MKKRMLSILLACSLLLGLVPSLALPAAADETGPALAADAASAGAVTFGTTISAGEGHMVVIKEDGTLWGWGYNAGNELGIGSSEEPVGLPVQIPVDNAVSVSASAYSTSVLTAGGELWNWGNHDRNGKLGREAEGDDVPPGKAMDGVMQISTGTHHGAAVTRDGAMWVWGGNDAGQLGNGGKGRLFENQHTSYTYEALPAKVLENVRLAAAGGEQTFAVLSDGSLWAWGKNDEGQLGNDVSYWNRYTRKHDESLLGVTVQREYVYEEGASYTTPGGVTVNVKEPFTTTTTHICQLTPVKVMEDVKKVDTDGRTIILKNDGSVWTCGGSRYLQPGEEGYDESAPRYYSTYAPQHVMDGAVDVATGFLSFAAIREDGSLWTWGDHYYGALGRETDELSQRVTPGKVMDDVVAVAVGGSFMAALKSDGSLWMWGNNAHGQLGIGSEERYITTPVKVMDGVALPGKTGSFAPAEELAMPGSASRSTPGAPASWMKIPKNAGYFGGNAYALYTGTNYTWSQAEAYCEQQGGHLAVISSPEELEYVRGIDANFYLGSYVDSAGYFQWVTGEGWYCDGWALGEPRSGNCLAMYGGLWYGVSSDRSPGYFLCEWEGGSTYTIYFDPNGGTVNAASKQVYNGYPCGTLPIAVRKGYSFQGWYTDDGRLASANSLVETTVDFTLHARWAVNAGGPTVNDVTYSFGNNSYDLGYKEGDRIPLERYYYMFGNNNAAREAYIAEGEWGGSCFGMSASATFLYMNNNPVPPSQLSLTDGNDEYTVKQLIEAMHIIQCSYLYQRARGKNDNNYAALATAVLNFRNANTEPIFISFWGPRNAKGERPGHAVLGLGVYRDAANRKDVIQIYDPNFPGDTNRYIDLYWSTPGQYTGWYYHVNDSENWGSAYDGGTITYATYSDAMTVWNSRGSETILTANTMTVNCANATIYDYAGNPAATIRDGQVTSDRGDIFPFVDPTRAGETDTADGSVTLWVPREYFTVVNEDPGEEGLSVRVSGQDLALSVTTSSDRVLVYANAGDEANVALVNGKDETYEMVFRSAEGEVRLTGTTKEGTPACFAQIAGELSGMGLGVGSSSQLRINGEAASETDVSQTTVVEVVSSTAPSNISAVFADVSGGSYYAPAVQWSYENGVTNGTGLDLFDPHRVCTRAEAVTLLWRALGCPTAAASVRPFADVSEGDYFYRAALWAAGTGLYPATEGALFSPYAPCTDQEFLTLLWQALGQPGLCAELAGYEDATAWARALGLFKDTDPDAFCLRRDAVTFLYRALS